MLLSVQALAQDQRPLPRGAPEVFVRTAVRVHVRVHEDLEPDRLRDLTRPRVTLWLTTRTNTLRASTLENVARFDVAWVQLRKPLKSIDATVYARAPSVGAWVVPADLEVASRLPGARRVAINVQGALSEALVAQLSKARPAELSWKPGGAIDLLSWGQFRQLPGRRIVVPAADSLLPVKCEARTSDDPSVELHVATLLALSSDVFPCGTGTRVVVPPETEAWLLQSLLVRDPSVELIIEIGADSSKALAARKLFDTLQLGPSR